MRALVTGGCGFIGSNLVHKLFKLGWTVDVVDDLSNGYIDHLDSLTVRTVTGPLSKFYNRSNDPKNPDVLVITDDFCSVEMAHRIISGNYDVIFHLAANPRVEFTVQNPVLTTEENLFKTIKLMGHSIKNVKRFVMASTSAIYGDPMGNLPTSESNTPNPSSPYAVQKLSCEQFGKIFSSLYDLDTVFLRMFNVYGPRQFGDSPYSTAVSAWCDKIKNNEPLRSDGDGEQTRDMVYVDDVVNAFIAAATRNEDFKGSCLNVGTGFRLSNNEILSILKSKYPHIEVNHAPTRPGDVRDTQADMSTVERELGWIPEHDFSHGLEKTLKWWGLCDEE